MGTVHLIHIAMQVTVTQFEEISIIIIAVIMYMYKHYVQQMRTLVVILYAVSDEVTVAKWFILMDVDWCSNINHFIGASCTVPLRKLRNS